MQCGDRCRNGEVVSNHLGAAFDAQLGPRNCYEAGENPFPKAWDQLDHSRISHIHLKDAAGKSWTPVGSGKIDFVGQFNALKKMNYSGTLSLETHYKNTQNDPYSSSVESMDGLIKTLKEV